jgi:hypothetical protein
MRPDSPERALVRAGTQARVASSAAALRPDERPAGEEARESDPQAEVRYWRARAAELEEQVEVMRARLLALAEHLPPTLATALGRDGDALAFAVAGRDVLEGWEETVLLKPSSVAIELPRLWERLRRDRET